MNVSTMRIVTGILGMLLSALCAGMGVSAAVAGASLLEAAVIWFCAALLGVGITVCGIAPHRPQRTVLAFLLFVTDWWLHRLVSLNS